MTETNNEEPELGSYIQSLPAGPRPTRDWETERQRLLPSLQAHAAREHRRVRRHRTLFRVASVTALGGTIAAGVLWVGLSSKRSEPSDRDPDGLSAASALTVLDGALLVTSGGVARTLHAGDSVGLAEVGALEASSDLAARVRLSDVAALTLSPASRVRPIASSDGRSHSALPALDTIALERGRVHLQVKKLGARRFHVVTPDADVEVRGTAFDVVLRSGGVPQTCVTVDEGLVLVASGFTSRLLSRGQSWGCDGGRAETPQTQAMTTALSAPPGADGARKEPTKRPAHAARSVEQPTLDRARPDASDVSDLGAQNQLFQTALAAERAGRFDAAARTYRRLLARAPHGPLAAQARANLAAVSSPRR